MLRRRPMSTATNADSTAVLDVPVTGMHCAACAASIEKALAGTPGVSSAGVNFATARATVRYDPSFASPEKLRDVVREAGYDIVPNVASESPDDQLAQAQSAEFRRV